MKNWKLTIAELKWTEKALAALALVYVGFHFLNLFMTFGPMGSKVIHISMGIGVLTLDLLRRHSGRSMMIVAALHGCPCSRHPLTFCPIRSAY